MKILNFINDYSDVFKSIGSIGTFITAVITFIKYKNEKHKDLYIRRLNSVYAPLYMHIATALTIRDLSVKNINKKDKEAYIKAENSRLRITHNCIDLISYDDVVSGEFDKKEFLKLLKSIEPGLMTPNLINLVAKYNAYEWLNIYDENSIKIKDKDNSTLLDITMEEILNEVYRGFKECVKEIGLDKAKNINYFNK